MGGCDAQQWVLIIGALATGITGIIIAWRTGTKTNHALRRMTSIDARLDSVARSMHGPRP